MNTRSFQKRLARELPGWRERGWVTEDSARAILDHLANHADSQGSESRHLSYALAILGALLLGSGVITWFAANWSEISKLAKLSLLLGSLYLSYGLGGYLSHFSRSPRVGEAILLLGVILFGANVMLIAQIYHIDSHFPDGILTWAAGGLVTAYALRSQPALVATIALALLWSGSESMGFQHFHGWFLLLWLLFLPAIYQWRWELSLRLALIALVIWSLFSFFALEMQADSVEELFLVQIYFLLYLSLLLIGMLMATWAPVQQFASAIQTTGTIGSLTSFYFLTFPRLQSGLSSSFDHGFRGTADNPWIALSLAAVALIAVLALFHYLRTRPHPQQQTMQIGRPLLGAIVLLIVANLFLDGVHGGPIAILFNLLFFGGAVWLVFSGMQAGNRFLVNLAFAYFALALTTRYFDTFWTLMNRSLFFIVGGIILIAGGYWLEQQRRRITSKIAGQETGGAL